MEPRDLRPVGPLRLVDRAFSILAEDPRRLVFPVWAGSAPLVLWALVFWVVERVEGFTGLRAVFAVGFALLVGPRTSGWAIAGRTIALAAEGQDPALEETREIQAAAERGAALVRRLFALGPRPDDATRRARPRSRTTSTTRRKKSSS